ncbi:MAG: 1,4-alpha-glucan branching protein domain-containing protein [Candidatus Eiseniibacteriota bacterium]
MSSSTRLASATATAPAPSALRGRAYGEDRLHLLVRDPWSVFATWEISPALAAKAEGEARAAGVPLRFQIRIEETSDGAVSRVIAVVPLADALGDHGSHIGLTQSGIVVRAHLGLDLGDRFLVLLTSRPAAVPPAGPAPEVGAGIANPVFRSASDENPRAAGYLSIVLHAHLPFVRHPEYEDPLEERWLVEALLECYLPILRMLEGRADRGAKGRLTISLSPTLLAMLDDPLLRRRFSTRLERLLALADRDVARYRNDSRQGALAIRYREQFEMARTQYEERYRRDVVSAFRSVEERGVARLITCGATHGFLPLMDLGPSSWTAQIGAAAREFERRIGRAPEGLWLPECGYTPGVEEVLARFGIRYFVVDAHAVEHALPRPALGLAAPLRTAGGVLALARDPDTSRQVWSATEGYPGDPDYREYYRDQGFDLPLEDVRDFLPSGGTRTHLGLKYHRITDRTSPHRELYDPDTALARVREHAAHFVRGREEQARHAMASHGQAALLLAPYDAELFGHWWYEGPVWLDRVLDEVERSDVLSAVDPWTAVTRLPKVSSGQLHVASWGEGGYCGVWLDPSNDWIYRHLLRAAERMKDLVRRGNRSGALGARALRQAGRELLLAQASDWAFIMKTGTLVPYACRRTEEHLARFASLAAALEQDAIDGPELAAMEARYGIFPDLEPGLFA